MKRYYVWRSFRANGQDRSESAPAPADFDHLEEAQRRGEFIQWAAEPITGGINPEWKQVGEFSWRLLTNGILTGIFIYDRKGNES